MGDSAPADAARGWWVQLTPHQRAFFTITMNKSTSVPVVQSSSESDSDDHVHGQVPQQSIILPPSNTIAAVSDASDNNAHKWPVTTQIPADLSVQVQDATFTVHKYPLVSKCGYIARLELQPSISSYSYEVKLETFPGGSETFEAILRFCYGLPLDLNPQNIAPLRCASEYLEMSEELEDGNLITKTEAFLTFVILSSWKDTITVLKTCEALSPWAENLQIVRRCCDSITWKASRENFSAGGDDAGDAWWLDDVATLHISHFTRIITAVRAKGTKPELVGKCIMQYASKWLTGMDEESKDQRGHGQGKGELQFSVLSGGKDDEYVEHKEEQTTIIENLISLLPPQQEAVPCRFLMQMLNVATVYSVRTVIQVLFSEQVKLRAAMQRKDPAESGNISEQEVHQTETKSEIMTLKAELENVKTRMAELQKDYLELQQEYAKLNNKHKHTLAWSWKRIRTSSLFHRKVAVDGVETVEGRQRSHSSSQAPNLEIAAVPRLNEKKSRRRKKIGSYGSFAFTGDGDDSNLQRRR